MYIQNVIVKSIKSDGLSFPLPEGSVVTVGGVTGIVPTTIDVRPATNRIYVAVAGTVDLTSDANKGVAFTDEQIKALGGDFNFVPAVEVPSYLPTFTGDDVGKVLTVGEDGIEWSFEQGGGGTMESGEYIPLANTEQPTISFATEHEREPDFCIITVDPSTLSNPVDGSTILTICYYHLGHLADVKTNANDVGWFGVVSGAYYKDNTNGHNQVMATLKYDVDYTEDPVTKANPQYYVSKTAYKPCSPVTTTLYFDANVKYIWAAYWL